MSDPVVEVWIAISGEYAVGPDEDSAIERFDDSVGGSMRRLVRHRRQNLDEEAQCLFSSRTLPS
jgi:hypothetical protein